MKRILFIYLIFQVLVPDLQAQDVIPKAKTREQKKADRKKMSLEERIEDIVPLDVNLPKASVNLPGENKITNVEDAKKFLSETLPGIASDTKAKTKKLKKARLKAREKSFDGKNYEKLAVEKQIFKRGSGERLIYMEFYTLREDARPSPYTRSLFWWDTRASKVVEAIQRDTKTNKLMHGPYKEYRGEELVKEGHYYLGAKHGRWEEYDKDFNLIEKETYNKGFYAGSEISYFGNDSSKIKEVIPVLYGKKTGSYWKFHQDGTLAEEGKLDNGVRVGKWIEYYEGGNRRKRETQYAVDYYDKAEPFTVREYDPNGKLMFEHESVKKL